METEKQTKVDVSGNISNEELKLQVEDYKKKVEDYRKKFSEQKTVNKALKIAKDCKRQMVKKEGKNLEPTMKY